MRTFLLVLMTLALIGACGCRSLTSTRPPLPGAKLVADPAAVIEDLLESELALPFRSWGGTRQGNESDTELIIGQHGRARLVEFGFMVLGYNGKYRIDSAGKITLVLQDYESQWPAMRLFQLGEDFYLCPATGDPGFIMGDRAGAHLDPGMPSFWPFKLCREDSQSAFLDMVRDVRAERETPSDWGSLLGPDIIRECPVCRAHLKQQATCDPFLPVFWTDGRVEDPWTPREQYLARCPKCRTILWMEEAKKLGEQHGRDPDRKWRDAVVPDWPSESDYIAVASAGKLEPHEEIYARSGAWWCANDTYRTNGNATVAFSPAQTKNLEALAKLMDENDPILRILKAEVFRELGRFQECIDLLSGYKGKERQDAADLILNLARQGVRIVTALPMQGSIADAAEATDSGTAPQSPADAASPSPTPDSITPPR